MDNQEPKGPVRGVLGCVNDATLSCIYVTPSALEGLTFVPTHSNQETTKMKQLSAALRTCFVIGTLFFFQTLAWAQETKEVDVNLNLNKETGGGIYVQPWMWVAGAALFVIVLVAIIMRGRSGNKTKIKTTEA